jgi:hypothetical protein
MPVLLVDDRDGRVVAELESQDEALRVLEALARDGTTIPEWYCLVELDSRHGAIVRHGHLDQDPAAAALAPSSASRLRTGRGRVRPAYG